MSECPECDYEQRTGEAAPVTHTCDSAEPEPRDCDTPLRMDQDRRDVEEARERDRWGI